MISTVPLQLGPRACLPGRQAVLLGGVSAGVQGSCWHADVEAVPCPMAGERGEEREAEEGAILPRTDEPRVVGRAPPESLLDGSCA